MFLQRLLPLLATLAGRLLKPLQAFGLLSLCSLPALAGFYVQDGVLRDANGNAFVMRGVSHAHVWFKDQSTKSINDIAATGANTVRLVLGNGRQWAATPKSEITDLIAQCKLKKMIAIPEVHDCTGYGDKDGYAPNAAPMSTAVDYWIGVKDALIGQENYVIINIANEPFGNGVSATTYANETKTAIQRLRDAGFTHTIMVDAGNWGQDWESPMLSKASEIFNADPLRNVIFSVHMYEVYQQDSVIDAYMRSFVNAKLVLVIGEFASTHRGSEVNEASIMSRAQQYKLGYLGWSWSGNSSDLAALDIVKNFDATQRSDWGRILLTDANGITATSVLCSVFQDTLTVSPASLAYDAAASAKSVTLSSTASWTASSNQSWLTLSRSSGTGNATLTATVSANTATSSRTAAITVIGSGVTRTVSVTQAGTVSDNNLALGRPASASSVESSTLPASNVVDGNMATRWSSTYSDAQWIQVDLGARYDLNRVVLLWETAYGSGYQVQVSDNGSTWSTILTITNGNGGTDDLAVVGTGRYLRINGTKRATQWGYSLWELRAYGTPAPLNTLTLSTGSVGLPQAGGTSSFSVSSNVAWTVSSNQSWLSASPASSSGNASVSLSASANNSGSTRSATITVSGGGITRTLAVTQPSATIPATVLHNFESGTEGWVGNGLSAGPWSVSEFAANGTQGLKADLQLSSAKTAYLYRTSGYNFSGKSTLSVSVRHAGWGVWGGAQARLYIKTGAGFTWVSGGYTAINGSSGTLLTLSLAGVANLADVREIGVQYLAGSSASGQSSVYLDYLTVQ